jgi:hypothetical protein
MRARLVSAAAIAALTAAAMGVVACGSDDDEPEQPTAAPAATEIAVFASPTIEGQKLTSTEKGYTVTFPDGWAIKPNFGTIGGESLDAAFLGEEGEATAVRPTLTIGCFPHAAGEAPESQVFIENRIAAVTALAPVPPVVTSREVAGVPAGVTTYIKEIEAVPGQVDRIRQQDVFFVGPLCSFSASLLSSPEDEPLYQPQFDSLLNSFSFVP